MAEGWARELKSKTIEAYSAGIVKHGLNPLAVTVMAEAGIDISKQISTTIDELPIKHFDWVVTLCGHAEESCPYFPGKKIHFGFDDPPQLAKTIKNESEKLIPYRRVRNEIESFINQLPEILETPDQ